MIGVDSRVDLLAVSGGYGAADIGMSVGREYPITVMIRKLCTDDPELAQALFRDTRGRHATLPSLLQYNPATCYIESIDDELAFTVLSGIPLVRYNIRDAGGCHHVQQDDGRHSRATGTTRSPSWGQSATAPSRSGRCRSSTCTAGPMERSRSWARTSFPRTSSRCSLTRTTATCVTFKLKVETTSEFSQRLIISLEHRAEELTELEETDLSAHYYALLVEGLRKVNADFRQSHDENPEAADPIVRVHARRTGPFAGHIGIKNRYIG